MALQTSVSDPSSLSRGDIPYTGPWVIQSLRLDGASTRTWQLGEAVTKHSTDPMRVRSCQDTNATVNNIAGIIVRSQSDSANKTTFGNGDTVSVLRFGPVVITAAAAIAQNDAIELDSDDGTDYEDPGSAGAVLINSSRAEQPISANANGVIFINVLGNGATT